MDISFNILNNGFIDCVRTPYATQKRRRSEGVRGITGEDLSSMVIVGEPRFPPPHKIDYNKLYII